MRTVLLASLRTYTRRYVAAVVAVVIAVGFVVVTNAGASAAKSGLSSGVQTVYADADLVVGDDYGLQSDDDVEAVADVAAERGDQTDVVSSGWLPVSAGGATLGDQVPVGSVSTNPALLTVDVESGRAPRAADEALVDTDTARSENVALGDTLTLGTGDESRDVTVVGTAADRFYLGADVYVPWETLSALPGAWADSIVYRAEGGSVGDARAALEAVVESPVRDADDYVDARVTMVNQGVDVISYLLLLFAAVAGFVAVLVVANTFTILFAQRARDVALLRCVGATRRQVLRAVRRESVVLAVAASTLGVVGGALVGYGLTAAVRAFAGAGRVGAVSLSPAWLVAAWVGGIVTTVAAAWWPTRSVLRVSPLDALRPASAPTARTRSGRVRLALGVATFAMGAAGLAVAISQRSMPLMLPSGMVNFVGILLLGPILVPALLRLLGRCVGSNPSARIAAANAVRNPRRSAATAASLLVGVTLATAVLTGMASARAAIDEQMDADHPVDAGLLSSTALPASVVEDVAATRDVERTVTLDGLVGTVGEVDSAVVVGVDSEALSVVRDRGVVSPAPDEVLLPTSLAGDLAWPETVQVRGESGTETLRPRFVSGDWGDAALVAPAVLDRLGPSSPLAAWVETSAGADPETVDTALEGVARDAGATYGSALEQRAYVDLQLDVLVWAVLGLLGVAVLIALTGIANTLGLSVLERGREHALLRALGLTRGQLQRVLAVEGVMLATVAAVLGTVVGTAYGWVGVRTVVAVVAPDATVSIPVVQLLAVVAVAALAGLAACVLPARRSGRVAPAAGLTLD